MASNVDTKSQPVGTALLEQLSHLDAASLSPATARTFLELGFSAAHQERVDTLSARARQGTLTPAEERELDDFLHVGNLLAILQSKARQVLKSADRPSKRPHGHTE